MLLHWLLQAECKDQKRFLSIAPHTRGHWESHRGWVFLLPGTEGGLLADSHGQSIEAVYSLHSGEPRIFWVWMYPLWIVQCPCNLPEVDPELLRWIEFDVLPNTSMDDVIVFSKTEEEHLQCLCVVFECFQEQNLNLKASKYEFFHNEINYLAHHVSKEGVHPSKKNLKAVAGFAPPQTYTEIQAFLGLVGHYQQLIKGWPPIQRGCWQEEWASNSHQQCTGCLWDA